MSLGVNRTLNELVNSPFNPDLDINIDEKELEIYTCSDKINKYIRDDQEVMQSGKPKLMIQDILILPNGQKRWIETNKAPLRDSNNNIIGLVGTFQDITERKIAELERKQSQKALLDSESRYRMMADNSTDLICSHALDGSYLYLSPACKSLLGYEVEELIGKDVYQFFHPEDIPYIQENHQLMYAHQLDIETMTFRYRHKNGNYIWLESSCKLIKDNQTNEPVSILAVSRNISQRKKAEEHIKRQLMAIEAAINGIGILQDNHFLYANKANHEMFGYSQGELIGKSWTSLYQQSELKYIEQKILPYLNTHKAWKGELKAQRKDGSIFEQGLSLTISNDGLLICVCEDITKRKQYEVEKLRLINTIQKNNNILSTISKAQSRFITEENHLVIFEELLTDLLNLTNSQYGFIGEVCFNKDGSATIEEHFFISKDSSSLKTHNQVASKIQKHYPQNYCQDIISTDINSLFASVITTGKPLIVNNPKIDFPPNQTPEGQLNIETFLGLPFFSGSNLIGIVAIANNIEGYTESVIEYLQPFLMTCSILVEGFHLEALKKVTEEKLFQSNQELTRATRLKDEFLATISHELRTPLNAILGISETLQEEIYGQLNSKQLKSIQTIEKSGNHLLSLINDILDLASIESGQMKLNLAPTQIKELCESSLVFVEQQALQKNLQISTDIRENLPTLMVEERRIRQVLINLLSNAIKFTDEGGKISLKVDLEIEKSSSINFISFTVKDNGIGITPENLAKLFKPFVQIDSALNRQYIGSGLGLTLVKKFVEMHQGKVNVISKAGEGSSFSFYLPCDDLFFLTTQSNHNFSANLSPKHNPPSIIPQNYTILLAEDNAATILNISSYLEKKGYKIILAKNGQEAIDLFKVHNPNLILMDILMPHIDGLEAIKRIRQETEFPYVKTPIIALTALAMPQDKEKCLAAGANHYLTKPIKLSQLANIIQLILAKNEGQ